MNLCRNALTNTNPYETLNVAKCLGVIRQSLKNCTVEDDGAFFDEQHPHIIIIMGASGNLARTKIYPILWYLYRDDLLPANTIFYAYARSKSTIEAIRENSRSYMNVRPNEKMQYEKFWKLNYYIAGEYSNLERLNREIITFEKESTANRLFYLALPPSVYEIVTVNIKHSCMARKGWTRIVVEKPFGKNLDATEKLLNHLASLFTEQQLYRIDHYMSKEMVQNIMILRFSNQIFSSNWNRDNIASVLILLKEPFGIEGRGGYFDEYGIIRDMMQNHLLRILSFITMEKPTSCQSDDIINERLRVLRSVKPLSLKDLVLGQYVGDSNREDEGRAGYLDEAFVRQGSITPTFAAGVLYISNKRWDGVPFILKCGKALDERKAEVRIQFKDIPGDIFKETLKRNELIIRAQPGKALRVKLMVKSPSMAFDMEETKLDLSLSRYNNTRLPSDYELSILDVFCGSQINFVCADELKEAWRIFTPVLNEIEKEKIIPLPYVYGSQGPKKADDLLHKNDFRYSGSFQR